MSSEQREHEISHWECGNCGREWDHEPESVETLFCRSGGGSTCAEYAVSWKGRAELAEARLKNTHEVEQAHRRHLRAVRDERDTLREQLAAERSARAALEAAQAVVAEHGKPAGHVYISCHHPTTQEGGDGCHRFASCHALWPERCEYMPHEHYLYSGDPLLLLSKALEPDS